MLCIGIDFRETFIVKYLHDGFFDSKWHYCKRGEFSGS